LKGFLLALLLHPEVQQAAQAEIDRIIGPDRLPTLADRDSLPYIEALLKEVHRWHTVAPMGLAHQADEDIIYNGFLIPKGAVLMANAW
jgi:cytochrome P450